MIDLKLNAGGDSVRYTIIISRLVCIEINRRYPNVLHTCKTRLDLKRISLLAVAFEPFFQLLKPARIIERHGHMSHFVFF